MNFNDIPQFTKNGDWECSYDMNRLVLQIEEFIVQEGLQMNPDFQRGHVWTEEQQIAFVEFILRGGKTGKVIYLNNPNWNNCRKVQEEDEFVCVDGLQRYTAIKRFINNEIKVFGCFYKDFKGSLRVYHMMRLNINNLLTKKDVLKWYLEMNGGGTPHTKEELDKVKRMLKKED